jgi:mannose-6-phosphate isomerase-like protein (cupin superfamily)
VGPDGRRKTVSDSQAVIFKYEKETSIGRKKVHSLCRTDRIYGAVQVVREGGETNLHSHTYLDGFWFVLSGRARFYTTDDEVLGELGPHEGILIPRGFPYWFERAGEDDLEIVQVEASSREAKTVEEFAGGRIDYTPPHPDLVKAGVSQAARADR